MRTHSITLPSGDAGAVSGAQVHWWYWQKGSSMVDEQMLTVQHKYIVLSGILNRSGLKRLIYKVVESRKPNGRLIPISGEA